MISRIRSASMAETDRLQELVAEVAAAYFSNSHVSPTEIPMVVQQIASSLAAVKSGPEAAQTVETAEPAPSAPRRLHSAQVKKSITPDALISFEDGRPYKTLRRHLATRGLTPEQYRKKWGLPFDYPMVAPSYSAARSAMAKSLGLGQMGRGQAAGAATATAKAPARGGRRKAGSAP
jgi:predicted transcriptional regulator